MKIIETHDIGTDYDEYYGKGSLFVKVTNDAGVSKSLTIYAGEPEDAVFFRDLDGAYLIVDLVKFAYEAGKRGEEMTYEFVDENESGEDEDTHGEYLCGIDTCTQCDTVCLEIDSDYGR